MGYSERPTYPLGEEGLVLCVLARCVAKVLRERGLVLNKLLDRVGPAMASKTECDVHDMSFETRASKIRHKFVQSNTKEKQTAKI